MHASTEITGRTLKVVHTKGSDCRAAGRTFFGKTVAKQTQLFLILMAYCDSGDRFELMAIVADQNNSLEGADFLTNSETVGVLS